MVSSIILSDDAVILSDRIKQRFTPHIIAWYCMICHRRGSNDTSYMMQTQEILWFIPLDISALLVSSQDGTA